MMFEIKGNDVLLSVTAKPNSHKFKVMINENRFLKPSRFQAFQDPSDLKIIICLKSRPEDNKANTELVKELERLLKKQVSFISGEKSKNKKLLIYNATEREMRSAFADMMRDYQ